MIKFYKENPRPDKNRHPDRSQDQEKPEKGRPNDPYGDGDNEKKPYNPEKKMV
jgi:hypothetical protein